ncbi:MAG TPA: metallopeptidase TldD-related protein [Anaeromyxobacteraceae bacterium]|nr:metallopeptidase TldD-related protein [Anaeromyxobacteraceae bacterium]
MTGAGSGGRMGRAGLAAALFWLAPLPALAGEDLPTRAMGDELARSMAELRLSGMEKPYFVSYRIDDLEAVAVGASLGSLTISRPARVRLFAVELRVGDYALDNGNWFSTRGGGGAAGVSGAGQAPLDDNYQEIRRQLWLATDAQYKSALEALSGKRAALEARRGPEPLPDFGRQPPVVVAEAPPPAPAPAAELEGLARELSAAFRSAPHVSRSSVTISSRAVFTRYVNSEGTSFTRASPALALRVEAETQAKDGMPVSDALAIHGRSAADLPPRAALLARVAWLASHLRAVAAAPTLERYNGPVLFEAPAAAEIVAQQLAPRLLAFREPVSDDPRLDVFVGQMLSQLGLGAFADRLGARVLPEFLDVTDDPRPSEYRGTPLLGGQAVDDDGVVPRATALVQGGMLKALLATRVPARGAPRSTGSRRGWGPTPSNLLVTASRSAAEAELRKDLLARARARGLDHALVVRRAGAGAASTAASRLAAQMGGGSEGGNTLAEVVRVFADGREEPLRGMEIAELSPAAFRDIAAAGDRPAVWSGEFMGTHARGLGPGGHMGSEQAVVSCVAPALLFEELTLVGARGPFPAPPVTPSPLAATR